MAKALSSILLYGGGIALEYAAATLRRALPDEISITVVDNNNGNQLDALYGTTMTPTSYNFNRAAGIEEPDLIMKTNTALSYGTRYTTWGPNLDWVQCFNLALPLWNGVRFHHYLRRMNEPLEPYLPGATVGRRGRFAHPPEDKQIPLSRAEYGYQFEAAEIAQLLKEQTDVTRIEGAVTNVKTKGGSITSVSLDGGETLEADLYIDASGPTATLMNSMESTIANSYEFTLLSSEKAVDPEVGPLRSVLSNAYGWQSTTPLRNKSIMTSVCSADDHNKTVALHDEGSLFETTQNVGHRTEAWAGNCIAVGAATAIIEPLTSAPLVLLMRDIERLVSLIPPKTDMQVEAKEYNRRYADDYEHAEIFHLALTKTKNLPDSGYWQSLKDLETPEKLLRKITQFESRGYLVNYDLEPFNEQDWTILHYGMGRRAKRHDVYIDHLDDAVIRKNLMMTRQSIESLVQKVPPHGTYMIKMQQYLERKHG